MESGKHFLTLPLTIRKVKDSYTEEEVKNFGLWLGVNFHRFKGKLIDDLFDEWNKSI